MKRLTFEDLIKNSQPNFMIGIGYVKKFCENQDEYIDELEARNNKLVTAIKKELARCGGTVPILVDVLRGCKDNELKTLEG